MPTEMSQKNIFKISRLRNTDTHKRTPTHTHTPPYPSLENTLEMSYVGNLPTRSQKAPNEVQPVLLGRVVAPAAPLTLHRRDAAADSPQPLVNSKARYRRL